MSSFLTVEDINTISINDIINSIWEFDLAELGEEDYTDVQVDFLKVTFKKDYQGIPYYYEIKAYNSTISDIVFKNNYGSRMDEDKIVVYSNYPLKMVVFLNSFSSIHNGSWYYLGPVVYLKKDEIGEPRIFTLYDWLNNTYEDSGVVNVQLGVNYLRPSYAPQSSTSLLCLLQKTDLQYSLTDTVLTVGKINHVRLNVDGEYLPSGSLVDGDELDAVVLYKGHELSVYYDASVNDYCFDLDLTEKFDDKSLDLTFKVYETKYLNSMIEDLRLKCMYQTAASFDELIELLNSNVEVIQLTSDIIADTSIILSNPVNIYGNGFSMDLDEYSIFIDTSVNVKFDSIDFVNGYPCMIQSKDSKLVLNNCSFTDCKITDEYKGSVLFTYDNENIVTEFNSCNILNSPHSIWHTGELTINKLTALYNNYENIDNDYSLLLTIIDGITDINNSDFNINFDTNILCSNQLDIKYAQSLISISEDAQLNGILGSKLTSNNSLNYLFNNNSSNIYCRYYYPKIESCVEVTPVQGFNGKSCCHVVLGVDWIFKNNVEIKRLD